MENKQLIKLLELAGISKFLNAEHVFRQKRSIPMWRSALDEAENPIYPNRLSYVEVMKDILDDTQVCSAMQIRNSKVLNKDFAIYNPDGTINDKLNNFFKQKDMPRKWVLDCFNTIQNSHFTGAECFQILIENNNVDFYCVPQEFLVPYYDSVKKSLYSSLIMSELIPAKSKDELFFLKTDTFGLGLLNKVAPLAIYKDALGYWRKFIARFGFPLVFGQTDTTDKDKKDDMEKFLNEFDGGGYALGDLEDQITFIETGKVDAYKIYEQFLLFCDDGISKVFLGGTSLQNESSFVGSAKIQASNITDIISLDQIRLANYINDNVMPYIERKTGFGNGCYMNWQNKANLSIDQIISATSVLLKSGYEVAESDIFEKLNIKAKKVEETENKKEITKPRLKKDTEKGLKNE